MNNIPGTISLDQDYYIDVDPLNFILKERKSVKVGENKGKQYESTIGYFGSLESALDEYVTRQIKSGIQASNDWSVEDVFVLLDSLRGDIKNLSLTLNTKQEDK